MFKKSTGISEVLEKLSKGFEQYVEILSHMRGEYFNILDRLSAGEVYHLERSIDKGRESRELKLLQDEFLDVYSEYLRTRNPDLKDRVEKMATQIRRIDERLVVRKLRIVGEHERPPPEVGVHTPRFDELHPDPERRQFVMQRLGEAFDGEFGAVIERAERKGDLPANG